MIPRTEDIALLTCLVRQHACSICLEEGYSNDWIQLDACHHWFHSECLSQWLPHSPTCPVCRRVVRNDYTNFWSSLNVILWIALVLSELRLLAIVSNGLNVYFYASMMWSSSANIVCEVVHDMIVRLS